jgi:DNA-binding NarL/FixJ family response regulator
MTSSIDIGMMPHAGSLTKAEPATHSPIFMIRVAIVEDNRTTREGLQTIINLAFGMKCVLTCATAGEALEKVPRSAPDVVLMDIQLPDRSGIECVSRLKPVLPDAQFIMVTVYEDPDRIFSALRAGACGYLLKRSATDQVVTAIRDVRHGGAPMSSEIARKVIAEFHTQGQSTSEVEQLSAREKEVLEMLARGFSNKDIADRMSITVESVRWHLKHIYTKLHVHSRTEAALKFREGGKKNPRGD